MATMKTRTRTKNKEEFSIPPTDEERARLMDPEYWDWDTPVEVIKSENPGLILHIRLEGDDVRTLDAAAHAAKMPLSRYILHSALEAARQR